MHDPRFTRTCQLIGEAGLERLKRAFVVVAGLGAVGSFAVEALARAGVGRLRLVDFDVVQRSNVNRQLFALESTLGRLKCEVARSRVLDIHPQCQVEILPWKISAHNAAEVLAGAPDLVLDAIDLVQAKADLIATAQHLGVPVLSSMGAARRTDPRQVHAGPFSAAAGCRLARQLRRHLKARNVQGDFLCVYSTEPMAPLGPGPQSAIASPTIPRDPRASLGSLPTLTGLFGLRLAHEALGLLLGRSLAGPRS